jgi:L-amino acid N-acyltransferase YncA
LKNPVATAGRSPDNFGWAAIMDDEVIAIATVTLSREHVGYLNCIVKPGRKHAGVGTDIFEYTLRQPRVKELIHLHAAIDPSNTAARQVLKEHGFTVVGNDDQGYLEYAKHKHY